MFKLILLQAKKTMKIEYKGTAATNLESLLQVSYLNMFINTYKFVVYLNSTSSRMFSNKWSLFCNLTIKINRNR